MLGPPMLHLVYVLVQAIGRILSDCGTIGLQCASLSLSGLRVIYPGSAAYNASESSYFATNVELGPSCIVQPLSSHDVSLAVTSLAKTSSICQFAIRSGGHATWAGANDISAPGVTIDLRLMNSTTYNSNNSTATILPGARWESVYETLDALNVAVPGGRAGPVGVGGLTIGGSMHSHRS